MTTIKTIPVSDRAWAVTLPGAVLAFNVDSDPDGRLSEVLSANPGMPAAFFNLTVCDEIFSMAENRVRSFVLADNPENRAAFADGRPVSMLSAGNILPAIPGGVRVTGIDRGFIAETMDGNVSVLFATGTVHEIIGRVTVAIVPEGVEVDADRIVRLRH